MNVIFFDGYCGLCNGFIDFMLKVDRHNVFRFSPLQSDFAKGQLPDEDITDLKSVVVLIDGQIYRKAPAVFAALQKVGGPWKALSLLRVLPAGFLNFGYDLVAENRYRLFGKRLTCRLPTAEEKLKFLL